MDIAFTMIKKDKNAVSLDFKFGDVNGIINIGLELNQDKSVPKNVQILKDSDLVPTEKK